MAKQILVDLDFNSQSRITNLLNAVGDQEPVTLAQLKSQIEGMKWKDDVQVSTSSNINLASPGSTLDGETMSSNMRVLVKGQTLPAENGIYIWNGPSTPMTRSLDANTVSELESALVSVLVGTSAGTTWRQTQVGFTLDSGDVLFGSFGVVAPPASTTTAGIIEIATQAEVNAGTDTVRAVTPTYTSGSLTESAQVTT